MREPSPLLCLSTALALLLAGCGFEPVVRPIEPRQLNTAHAQLLGPLDARGEYVLLGREQADAALVLDILHWRSNRGCQLPADSAPLGRALLRGTGARGPTFYLPLARQRSEGETELLLVDEHCALHDGLGLIAPRSPRVHAARSDDHLFLTYRDAEDTLFVLDPYTSLAPVAIARAPGSIRAGKDGKRDALWLIEAGRLTQRSLEGERLRTLGRDVTSMVLDGSDERLAFVDGGALYEAVAPTFVARQISPDGCSPRYTRDTLEFFAPCAQKALIRIHISRRQIETFEAGVYASSVQDGVQLDYAELEESAQLFAQFQDSPRLPVTPMLRAGDVYVLDDERLIGLDPQQRFGVWNRRSGRFVPLFSQVEDVIPHHRGKTHNYSWLLYHDVQPDGLGSLSLLDEEGMLSAPIAHGVPSAEVGGYSVINGNDLPRYPFSAPLVITLEGAAPLPSVEPRFHGRLRALSMRGEPSVVLAEDVSSYALVATPAPGVLFTVEGGPGRGLWYAAL
jgi:hypothetical protein